jgi:ABC-type lipoprotein release transport system permease subunit
LQDKEPESSTGLMNNKGITLDMVEEIRQRLQGVEQITHLGPVIFEEANFLYQLEQNGNSVSGESHLRVLGVQDAGNGHFVPEINRMITDQRQLTGLFETDTHAVLLSTSLYEQLFGAAAEGTVTQTLWLIPRQAQGEHKPLQVEVIGVFKLGIHQIAKNLIVTSLPTAQRLFHKQGYASFLGLSLSDPYLARDEAEHVIDVLADNRFSVFNWLSVAADLFHNLSFYKSIIFIILFMSILITSFTIYNTLTIMILERKKQIGVLIASGIKRRSIYRIFVFISQIVALAGSVGGVVLGVLSGNRIGVLLNEILKDFLPVQDASVYIHVGSIVLFVLFVCLACFVAAFLSARKAAHLNPVECLQAE